MKCNKCDEEISKEVIRTSNRISTPNGTKDLLAYHLLCSPNIDNVYDFWPALFVSK